MNRLVNMLRRLSSPRNILPLVIIFGAVVGVFEKNIFGLTVKAEQIIISLLGFLAIDALIERMDLLTNIEHKINSLLDLMKPKTLSESFLQSRDFHNVEKIINSANNEICIYGVTLDGLITLVNPLQEKLNQGCKVKILAPDPAGNKFQAIADYFGSRKSQLGKRLKGNLDNLSIRFM